MLYNPFGTPQAALEDNPNIPRCHHIRANGVQCGSPSLKGKRLCYFHARVRRTRASKELPLLEDANAIQLALMQTMRAILDKSVDHKSAGLLLYALQTAAINSRRVDFEPLAFDVVRDLHGAIPSDEKHERKRYTEKKRSKPRNVAPFRAKHFPQPDAIAKKRPYQQPSPTSSSPLAPPPVPQGPAPALERDALSGTGTEGPLHAVQPALEE